MSFIARELERIAIAMRDVQEEQSDRYAQLYAIQQALRWATDPTQFRSPYDMVMGTQEDLEGYSAPSHQPLS